MEKLMAANSALKSGDQFAVQVAKDSLNMADANGTKMREEALYNLQKAAAVA